jgi:hypothetical protein
MATLKKQIYCPGGRARGKEGTIYFAIGRTILEIKLSEEGLNRSLLIGLKGTFMLKRGVSDRTFWPGIDPLQSLVEVKCLSYGRMPLRQETRPRAETRPIITYLRVVNIAQ